MSIRASIKTILNGSMAGAGGAAAVLAVGFGVMQVFDYRVDVRAGQIKESIQREFNQYVHFYGRGVVVHDPAKLPNVFSPNVRLESLKNNPPSF